ncbi:MAG: hypothetical protein RLZZ584_1103 [Pseudomonadota bacterium]
MTLLTMEAVLGCAPDDASAKAARGLTAAGKWPLLGADAAAAWGECQGSGARPYQTQVDFSGPAFRCSCPSRKFPCKHGLALLMLRVQAPQLFTAQAAPPWVSEWLASRSGKAQRKEARQADQAGQPPAQSPHATQADLADPATAAAPASLAASPGTARRQTLRWQRIQTAGTDLQRWLADQLAAGLGALDPARLQAWQTMAARLVDAQAPGLAYRLREAAAGVQQRDADWPERTLQCLGLLQLACEALQGREQLPPAVQADLRSAVGWPHDQAEVLAGGDQVPDRWTVLGLVTEEREDKLTERRVWLHGARSGRRAWLLDHAYAGRGFEQVWLAGSSVQATLAFFPGAAALRALCATAPGTLDAPVWPAAPLSAEWDRIAARVAACPWIGLHPLVVRDGVALQAGDGWLVAADGRALPLQIGESDAWALLAVSGGRPCHLMGEWDGHALRPLTAWAADTPSVSPPLWQRSNA